MHLNYFDRWAHTIQFNIDWPNKLHLIVSIAELASSSVVFALLQPAPATFSCLSPADSLYVTVTFGPSVSESLFQVSFHWCSGLTAGHRESSLHPQRPTPPSLTSGNFYSCHMLSQMTQLSLQLPSLHSAPSSHLASRPSPIFLSPAAPVLEANLFFSTARLISKQIGT